MLNQYSLKWMSEWMSTGSTTSRGAEWHRCRHCPVLFCSVWIWSKRVQGKRKRRKEYLNLGQRESGCLYQGWIWKVSSKAHGKSLSQLRSSCSGGGGVPMEGVNLTLSRQSSDQTHLVMPYTSLNYILEIALHLTVTKPHASYFVFHSVIKQDSFSWVWSLQELHLLTNSPSNLCCVLMYYSDRLHHACNPS